MLLTRSRLILALCLPLLPNPTAEAQESGSTMPASAPVAPAASLPLEVQRAEGQLPLLVPRAENLQFAVRLSLGPVEARVGTVTIDGLVEPYRRSLLRPGAKGANGTEIGVLRGRAFGSYTFYSLDHLLETRFLPQDWPRVSAVSTQDGSEKRRHELLLGYRGGEYGASLRNDTKHGAPRGTRVWRDPVDLPAPAGALDSLGAVLLLRTMRRDGIDRTQFVMLDKDHQWQVELSFGEAVELDLPAGRFRALPVQIATQELVPASGEVDPESKEFSGPFGLRGNIQLWVEERTGVPIQIAGNLPAGPINVDIEILLERYSGTPKNFGPLGFETSRVGPKVPSGG